MPRTPPAASSTAALEQARRRGRDDLVERLHAERDRLDRPECTVLVVGEFNKGKSSLVNALLNARVCATDADVATAVPTLVRYAAEFGAADPHRRHRGPTPSRSIPPRSRG